MLNIIDEKIDEKNAREEREARQSGKDFYWRLDENGDYKRIEFENANNKAADEEPRGTEKRSAWGRSSSNGNGAKRKRKRKRKAKADDGGTGGTGGIPTGNIPPDDKREVIFLDRPSHTAHGEIEPRPVHETTAEVLEVLKTARDDLYRRGHVGYVAKEDDIFKFKACSTTYMQQVISSTCNLMKLKLKGKDKKMLILATDTPPRDIANGVLEYHRTAFDEITCVVNHPFFQDDKIIYEKGTHTGVYLIDTDTPPDMDGRTANDDVSDLWELVKDYNIKPGADEENLIALILTPFIRQSVDVAPYFFITAPKPGLGKSTIAEICSFIALGRRPETEKLSTSKSELDKSLNTTFREAPEIIFFDNIASNIDNEYLASVATQPRRKFRVLGVHENEVFLNKATFIYTGNAMTASKEIAARSVQIAIEDKGQQPHKKDDWTFHNIFKNHLQHHYKHYQACVLRMIQRWINAGMPESKHKHRMGQWASIVGGILEVNGLGKHFLANADRMMLEVAAEDTVEEAAWRIAGASLLAQTKDEKTGEYSASMEFIAADVLPIFLFRGQGEDANDKDLNLLERLPEFENVTLKTREQRSRATKVGQYVEKKSGHRWQCGFQSENTFKKRRGVSVHKITWHGTQEELKAVIEEHAWLPDTDENAL